MKPFDWRKVAMETPGLLLMRISQHEPLAELCDDLEEKKTDPSALEELETHKRVYRMKLGFDPGERRERIQEIRTFLDAKKKGELSRS